MKNNAIPGGPAFPAAAANTTNTEIIGFEGEIIAANSGANYSGMSLRDYFAAKAMVSSASVMSWRDLGYTPQDGLSDMEQSARLCYQMADAMIAERAK